MSKLNPAALNLWLTAACFGFYFGGIQGLVLCLGVASSLSLLASIFSK